MNLEDYIKSGIIESYVLGLADPEDVLEIEKLRLQYPEFENAIQAFELELEETLLQNSIPPSARFKENLFNSLNLAVPEKSIPESNNAKFGRTISMLKYFAAASILLLLLSVGFNVYTYKKYKNVLAENQQLALQRTQLFASKNATQTKFDELKNNLQAIASPNVVKVLLNGVPGKETQNATIYWNKATKQVYLAANHLQAAPKGKQYQLWALADGKPIDAGVITDCTSVCELKNIQNAQAFAITLEKEGGSPTPDLTQLFMMGNI